jgi:hypothetical protein
VSEKAAAAQEVEAGEGQGMWHQVDRGRGVAQGD